MPAEDSVSSSKNNNADANQSLRAILKHPLWTTLAMVFLLFDFIAILLTLLVTAQLLEMTGFLSASIPDQSVSLILPYYGIIVFLLVALATFGVSYRKRNKPFLKYGVLGCTAGLLIALAWLVVQTLALLLENQIAWLLLIAIIFFLPGAIMLKEALNAGEVHSIKETVAFSLASISLCAAIALPALQQLVKLAMPSAS